MTIIRYQNKSRPQLPGELGDLNIEPPYDVTLGNKRFLQYDSKNDDGSDTDDGDTEEQNERPRKDRIIMFYTDKNLEYLVRSKTVFCDGTFKTAPSMFYQLYSIHGKVFGHVFPLVYILATRKDEPTYKKILDKLKGYKKNYLIFY